MNRKLGLRSILRAVIVIAVLAATWLVAAAPFYQGPCEHFLHL
jgi:hypothetical protein